MSADVRPRADGTTRGHRGAAGRAVDGLLALLDRLRSPAASTFCDCEDPLLDSDVGAVGSDHSDDWDTWCWRCHRPITDD